MTQDTNNIWEFHQKSVALGDAEHEIVKQAQAYYHLRSYSAALREVLHQWAAWKGEVLNGNRNGNMARSTSNTQETE